MQGEFVSQLFIPKAMPRAELSCHFVAKETEKQNF
jgi:hypothetical protein